MRVAQRLFFAVVPAILGVLVVAALAYWGEYGRQAPRIVVAVAVIASVVSLVVAWRNTHYVAQRLEQLARRDGAPQEVATRGMDRTPDGASADVLDTLERTVERLRGALATAEGDRARLSRTLEARAREYADLLAAGADSAVRSLDEVRLPIHILLENRFGDLNENQEEMLENARAAAERADTEMHCLWEIAELDRGGERLRRDRVRLADVVASLRPVIDAEGTKRGVRAEVDIPPALPPLLGDRARLQEALAMLLTESVHRPSGEGVLRLAAERHAERVLLRIEGGGTPARTAAASLARRIIEAHGGAVAWTDGTIEVTLPLAADGGTEGAG